MGEALRAASRLPGLRPIAGSVAMMLGPHQETWRQRGLPLDTLVLEFRADSTCEFESQIRPSVVL